MLEYAHRHQSARVYRNRQDAFICTDEGNLFNDIQNYLRAVAQPIGALV